MKNKKIIIIIGIVLCLGLSSIFIFKNNNLDNNSEIGDTGFCWNDDSDEIINFIKGELDEKLYYSGNLKTIPSGKDVDIKSEFGETKILEYNNIDFYEMEYFNNCTGNYIVKIGENKDSENMILSKRYEIDIDYTDYMNENSYFKSEVEEIINDYSSIYGKPKEVISTDIKRIFKSDNGYIYLNTWEEDLKFILTISYLNPIFNLKDLEKSEIYYHININEFSYYL